MSLAQVAELADALASGASSRKGVEVRVLSWAPYLSHKKEVCLLEKLGAPAEDPENKRFATTIGDARRIEQSEALGYR
jgi:hypothetical protein